MNVISSKPGITPEFSQETLNEEDFVWVPECPGDHPTRLINVLEAGKYAADAYHPYKQSVRGQEEDLSSPVLIKSINTEGSTTITEERAITAVSNRENVRYFKGVTGFGSKTTFGCVSYEPSALEKALKTNPKLISEQPEALKNFSKKRTITIAMRGTQTKHGLLPDWITNFWSTRKAASICADSKGYVHTGFEHTFLSMKDEVEAAIREFLFDRIGNDSIEGLSPELAAEFIDNTEIKIVGHSLGGALATICANWLNQRPDLSPNAPTLWTFASPRVGDEAFFEHHGISYDSHLPSSEPRVLKHVRVERFSHLPLGGVFGRIHSFCQKGFSFMGDIVPCLPLRSQGFVEAGEPVQIEPVTNGSIKEQHDIKGYLSSIQQLMENKV